MTSHDHSSHDRHQHSSSQKALLFALVFTTFFAIVEAVAGWWSNSLALIGDAGHMVTDSLALGLGALAAWMSRKSPSARHSYGLLRAETVGALLNVLFMLAVITFIVYESVQRLAEPTPVKGGMVMVVATIGLFVNIGAAWVLHRGEQNLNVKGAMLHVMGDLLGSVAALAAGAVILFTSWYPIDPILSLFISLLILVSSLRLLRDVLHVVMEGVPQDVDLEEVGEFMADNEGVSHVHDLHVWMLDSSTYALSAHVVIADMGAWETTRSILIGMLTRRFGIEHATLQPESEREFDQACADGSCGPVYPQRDRPPAHHTQAR